MVYRRTHQVVRRLAARRSAILAAARDAAADGGMAAVQIAPVAIRANVAAGTVYRYFPSKADLISELIAEVSRDELAAIRRAADAAPGPSSALAAAGVRFPRLNLGGIHHRPGRTERLPYVFLTDAEIMVLRALAQTGIEVTAQDVPATRPVPLAELR